MPPLFHVRASRGPAMKRVDRLRIRHDDEIARLMQTEAGRAEYWGQVDAACRQSPLIGLLEESLMLEGDVIECGVYRGTGIKTVIGNVCGKKHFGVDFDKSKSARPRLHASFGVVSSRATCVLYVCA